MTGWCKLSSSFLDAMWDHICSSCWSDSACVVGDLFFSGDNSWKAKLLSSGTDVLIVLLPGSSFEGTFRASLFGFEASYIDAELVLFQRERSALIKHSPWSPDHCTCVKEACAGVGALGFGLSRAGFQVTARNEVQGATAEVLKGQSSIPTVTGDICLPKVVLALGRADERPAGLAAGVSCQPYSALGDQKQGSDARSASLPGVLRASYLLQSAFVLLECPRLQAASLYKATSRISANSQAFMR